MGVERGFHSIAQVGFDVADLLEPQTNEPPWRVCEQNINLHNPGGYTGPFKCVPYMKKPLELLADRSYQQIVFVSSAQCMKTVSLVIGTIGYNQMVTKSDTLLIQTTQDVSRTFGNGELTRMFRTSPKIGRQLVKSNMEHKEFRAGNRLLLGWPSINQLSGKSYRYVLLTDYDRYPTDIDGEGEAIGLAMNRIKAFGSRGKVICESSPKGFSIPGKPEPPTLHHFEDSNGIVSHYHNGTMCRWYWPCTECGEYFQARPTFEKRYLWMPDSADVMEKAYGSRLICPHCAGLVNIHKHREEMLERGDWVGLGQKINKDGVVEGEMINTNIASFALAGYASYLQKPADLVLSYLNAQKRFASTGDEKALMEVHNTQLGTPYKSTAFGRTRSPHELEARGREGALLKAVPNDVLYLLGVVDVQGNRFVVQIHGYSLDEEYLIDRFSIRYSRRYSEEIADNKPIAPARYIEDWSQIERYVMDATYVREDGAEMSPVVVGCDSGGAAGVTEKAYTYYKSLADRGMAHRFALLKGASKKDAPRVKETRPDRRKNTSKIDIAQGDIPVYMINTHIMKDGLYHDLDRAEPGPGFIHFPQGLETEQYAELTRESKTEKGWVNLTGDPNEMTDLFVYARALRLALRGDAIDLKRPPKWVTLPMELAKKLVKKIVDFKSLGAGLNG